MDYYYFAKIFYLFPFAQGNKLNPSEKIVLFYSNGIWKWLKRSAKDNAFGQLLKKKNQRKFEGNFEKNV